MNYGRKLTAQSASRDELNVATGQRVAHPFPWDWIPHKEGEDRQSEINRHLRELVIKQCPKCGAIPSEFKLFECHDKRCPMTNAAPQVGPE